MGEKTRAEKILEDCQAERDFVALTICRQNSDILRLCSELKGKALKGGIMDQNQMEYID